MPYGTIKVDTITFTDAGVDKSIAISGLVQNPTFSGNITVTGTVSGTTVRATTVSGVTISGTTINAVSGVFTTEVSGAIVKVPAGSAGVPSIQVGVGATVAPGLYGAGTDILGISTGGAGRLFIDSTGDVGIGTSSPAEKLDVSGGNIRFGLTGFLGEAGAGPYDIQLGPNPGSVYSVARNLAFYTNAGGGASAERMRIDSSGRLLVGTTENVLTGTSTAAAVQINSAVGIVVRRNENNTSPANITLGKSRNTADGSYTILQNGDDIGELRFAGDDGTDLQTQAAKILCQVDGTPGANDMPGRLIFSTSTDASPSVLTERMRIDSAGRVGIGGTATDKMLFVSSPSTSIFAAGVTGPGETYGTGNSAANLYNPLGTQFTIVSNTPTAGNAALIDFNVRDAAGVTGVYLGATCGPTLNGPAHLVFGRRTAVSTWAETARIDSSGRLLVGTDTATQNIRLDQKFSVVTEGGLYGGASLVCYGGTTASRRSLIDLKRSRGTTDGTMTAVINNDDLGLVGFHGADGTNFIEAASINGLVDGAVATNSMPGRLVFSTNSGTVSASPTERLRIDSAGVITISGGGNIKADFSNATVINRTYFQTSTANSESTVSVIPNGTSTASTLAVINNSTPTNASSCFIRVTSTAAELRAGILGTGTYLPIDFYTNNIAQLRIDTSGNITLSTGNNILADFSNATVVSRTYFQTSTANGQTIVGAIPNGTGTSSAFYTFNNSTPTNASYVGPVISTTASIIRSSATGTGTLLPLTFETNNQEQARFTTTDRYFRMASGTGGIQFQGDTAAANALDDYEEGTFTPTVIGTTVAGTGTYSAQVGRYTKIGNTVRFQISMTWSAHTGTGNMRIAGLPFTNINVADAQSSVSVAPSNLTFSNSLSAFTVQNTTQVYLRTYGTGGAEADLPIDTAASIRVAGDYEAA